MCHVTLYHCKQGGGFPGRYTQTDGHGKVNYKSSPETVLNMWGMEVSLKTSPSRSPCALRCLQAYDVDQRCAHDPSRRVTSPTSRAVQVMFDGPRRE